MEKMGADIMLIQKNKKAKVEIFTRHRRFWLIAAFL